MDEIPGVLDRWTTVLGLLDQAVQSILEAANTLTNLAGGEFLALEARRLEAEVSLLSIQVRRTRAGLN